MTLAPPSAGSDEDHTRHEKRLDRGPRDPSLSSESGDGLHSNGTAPDRLTADIEAAPVPQETPYSVFSRRQKIAITIFAAFGGLFSPISASIYFPALNPLADDLHVSVAAINLTLTTYLIFQGLAPSFMGNLADMSGRRPTYVVCFVIYMAANVGIAVQNSYPALLVLRCMQSSGSSGTISLANAIVADVAPRSQRGSYMGWTLVGAMLGPAFGPVLGGLLSQFLGWRAIFWFLIILAVTFLVPFLIFCPETCRNVVGDGSIPPPRWNMSLINYLVSRRAAPSEKTPTRSADHETPSPSARPQPGPAPDADPLSHRRRIRFPNPLNTLRIITEKDISLLLFVSSMIYVAFYDILATMPSILKRQYGYNDLEIGLSYLPYGVGALVSTPASGHLVDRVYRRMAAQHHAGDPPASATALKEDPTFPIEKARIVIAGPLVVVGAALLVAYGWALWAVAPVAVLFVLQFIMAICFTGAFNSLSTLLVDLYPLAPATATAANNLVRCLVGAAGTSFVEYQLTGLGAGWCFTLMAGVLGLTLPVFGVLIRWGPVWREARRLKREAQ